MQDITAAAESPVQASIGAFVTNLANLNEFPDMSDFPNLFTEFISAGMSESEVKDASELPNNAMPDFLAGFMNGITGHNHKEDLEGCFIA